MEKSMLGSAGLLTSMPDLLKEPLINLTKATEPSIGLSPIFTLSNAESVLRQGLNKRTKTVCTYCGVGCSFDVLTRGRHILKIQPEHGPANGVSTCVKGKFAWEFVNASDRLRTPFIRDGGKFRRASFEEAFDYIAQRLKEIEANSGPDAIGVIASSKCTNEEAYLAQKLARAVIGTNNVDNCSRYCQSPATMGLWRTVGYGGDSGSIRDLELAKLVLIIGSNTAESHPVIATRIKRSHKQGRSRLIVADLRSHEMAERADLFIRPRPGTDLVWLSAVTKLLIDRGSYAKEFVDKRVIGFDEYVRSIERYDLDYASTVCGLPASLLEQLADEIESADSMAICWAMGVTQHAGGSDTSTAISNLLLITGNYGRPGTGAYPLRGHNNVQGASDFGAMPTYMPGYEPVADEAVMNKWEHAWGVPLPRSKGLDNHQMVDAIHEGKLRALLLTGEEMGLVDANAHYVQEAFSKLEFFVVQDIFFSQTARFADVVLPASPSLEKSGTFTNTERRIQRLYRVFEPLAGSLPDWQITQGIANALGANWSYNDPSEIMDEVARTAEIFRGVTYDRLRGYASLQWPVDENGTDSPLLYTDSFHFPDGKARLFPLEWQEPSEQTDDEFDLHLNNGRLLEHFHEGNMTYRVSGISETTPEPFVEVSSELARERKLTTGTLVRLISRRGSIKVRVVVTDRVHGNQLYLPLNSRTNESAVNVLTSSATDRATDTPAYKELAVRMEVLPNEIAVPLPRRNFRFGTRTPQRGVKVDEKRKRSDYVEPWAGKISGR
jgi:formate dehydrogenase major subunit